MYIVTIINVGILKFRVVFLICSAPCGYIGQGSVDVRQTFRHASAEKGHEYMTEIAQY